jgi:hypothetical protein
MEQHDRAILETVNNIQIEESRISMLKTNIDKAKIEIKQIQNDINLKKENIKKLMKLNGIVKQEVGKWEFEIKQKPGKLEMASGVDKKEVVAMIPKEYIKIKKEECFDKILIKKHMNNDSSAINLNKFFKIEKTEELQIKRKR